MLKMINGRKTQDNVELKNINFEFKIGESIVITAQGKEKLSLLLKVLSGVYQLDSGSYTLNDENILSINDKFFYVNSELCHNDCETVHDLIFNYTLYYTNFNRKGIAGLLNSVNICMQDRIENLSNSYRNFIYLVIGLCSNASYIFFEDLFTDVNERTKKIMKNIIQEHSNNKCFILTSTELNDFKDVITHIGICRDNIELYSIDHFDDYSKFSISYYNEIDLEAFKKYNLRYINALHRTAIIIVENSNSTSNFFLDSEPIIYDKLEFDLSDIYHCIGVIK